MMETLCSTRCRRPRVRCGAGHPWWTPAGRLAFPSQWAGLSRLPPVRFPHSRATFLTRTFWLSRLAASFPDSGRRDFPDSRATFLTRTFWLSRLAASFPDSGRRNFPDSRVTFPTRGMAELSRLDLHFPDSGIFGGGCPRPPNSFICFFLTCYGSL